VELTVDAGLRAARDRGLRVRPEALHLELSTTLVVRDSTGPSRA
jgi:hypothetical protein